MDLVHSRDLRYFVTVAEERSYRRAAERLNMAQPPLTRTIQQLERRLGVTLLERDKHRVDLTAAGEALLQEGRVALDAIAAATRRAQRAGAPTGRVVLAVKAGADHDLLRKLLHAHRAEPDVAGIEVLLCGIGEQPQLLRDGRADAALVHEPFDLLSGFESLKLMTEGQVAILPAEHDLARRTRLTLAEVSAIPGLPLARWPRHDGTYPDGPGPEVHDQAQLAQLVALGLATVVLPESGRAWLWTDHVAVPVTDAPPVSTVLVWPAHSRSAVLDDLIRTATRI